MSDEEFKRFVRSKPSQISIQSSMMSIHEIPMIRITDTDPVVVPIRIVESVPALGPSTSAHHVRDRPSLVGALEDDGVRVIFNKRLSEQTGFGGSSSEEQTQNRAAVVSDIRGKGKPITWGQWRRRMYTILWINLLMRYRSKTVTLLEIFLPVLVMLIFIASLTSNFNWTVGKRARDEQARIAAGGQMYDRMSEESIRRIFCSGLRLCNGSEPYIAYTPHDNFTRRLMADVVKLLLVNPKVLKPVRDEGELLAFCKSRFNSVEDDEKVDPIGIVFLNEYDPGEQEFPRTLSYQIRTFTAEISDTSELFPYIEVPREDQLISPYIYSGFVGLQNAIDKAFVDIVFAWRRRHCNCIAPIIDGLVNQQVDLITFIHPQDIDYNLQMFPFTLYLDLKVRHLTWASIMLSIILGYFCTAFFSTKQVIIDLDSGILELLKLHGLVAYMHWLSLLFHDVILRAISCIFMTWIMFANVSSNGGVLEYDDPFLVWLFFFLHGASKTASDLFVAIFFSKPTLGGIFTFSMSFFTFFIPFNMYTSGYITSRLFNVIMCFLLPNWCLANGLYHFLKFESYETGVTWESSGVYPDEDKILIPLAMCSIIFVLNIIFYMMLTIYVDRVSHKYLSPKEDYLFFLKNWTWKFSRLRVIPVKTKCRNMKRLKLYKFVIENPVEVPESVEELDDDFVKPPVYEPEELVCKVKCRNVTHHFGHSELALDDVSLNFYEDQITIILGYSGSGKSTLLHVLAGLITPPIGMVRILGVDPASNKQVRFFTGFCPQKLILFPTLSVEEHLRLSCLLHSSSYDAAKELSNKLLVRFNLWEQQRVGVRSLNEGQKRKLAIAMALSTNPPILILDEPTFGMDSASRHEIWDSLRYLRGSRTIIVSVSSMDEAEMYGDKIVLMAKGKVLCFGSPSYLKHTYNTGSFLKVRKAKDDPRFASRIVKFLYDTIDEGIHEVKQTGYDDQDKHIYLALPHDKHHKFSKIMAALEERKDELGIANIKITHATLGGIFYKLAHDHHLEHASSTLLINKSDHSVKIDFPTEIPELPTGIKKDPNFFLTLTALFTKQMLYIRQKYCWFLVEYFIPLFLIICFVKYCETYVSSQPGPTARPLTANTYPEPPIPILLDLSPNDDIDYWEAAFDGVVGSTKDRVRYFRTSDEDEEAFRKSLLPSEKSFTDYHSQVVVAFSRNKNNYIGWYASNALHSAPIAQNMLTNAILHLMTLKPDRENTSYRPFRIQTANRPIPLFATLPTGTIRDATNALAGVVFGFMLALIAASKIGFCIVERATGIKSIQLMTGVHPLAYWAVVFCCDVIVNALISVLIWAIFYFFDTSDVFHGAEAKLTAFVMTLLYLCWACLPFGYVISKFMDNTSSGYGQYMTFHILLGSLPELASYLLLRSEVTSFSVFNVLRYCFLIFPSYGITAGFVHFCELVARNNFCLRMPLESSKVCRFFENVTHSIGDSFFPEMDTTGRLLNLEENDIYFHQCCQGYCKPRGSCLEVPTFFNWGSTVTLDVPISCIFLVAQGIFYWILLILMEYEAFSSLFSKLKATFSGDLDVHKKRGENYDETLEMKKTRDRINLVVEFDEPSEDILLVADVTKFFGKKKALENIYFCAEPGEILGVLGPPACGKTILMRIMSGDLASGRGTVVINKTKLHTNRNKYHQNMAYCPQGNPILNYLTGYQMMELIARLRGLPISYIDIHIRKWLELMGFEEQDWIKLCKFYPPGMKRRLACALTLIGNPKVLMFDEPTWGLDPLEHLGFWNLLTQLQKHNQTIIYTSSRAEENIQVTTKLVLLRNGQVMDMGTPEEIYERYANGWTLVVRYRPDISQLDSDKLYDLVASLHEYILSVFSPCQLKDEYDNFILYNISDSAKTLSYMYEHMESAKEQLQDLIDDYFITEANLDDAIGNLPTYSNVYKKHSSMGLRKRSSSATGSATGST